MLTCDVNNEDCFITLGQLDRLWYTSLEPLHGVSFSTIVNIMYSCVCLKIANFCHQISSQHVLGSSPRGHERSRESTRRCTVWMLFFGACTFNRFQAWKFANLHRNLARRKRRGKAKSACFRLLRFYVSSFLCQVYKWLIYSKPK